MCSRMARSTAVSAAVTNEASGLDVTSIERRKEAMEMASAASQAASATSSAAPISDAGSGRLRFVVMVTPVGAAADHSSAKLMGR